MEKYIKTRNLIANICNQSGLSLTELCGVLSECLADVRDTMVSEALHENAQLREQMVRAAVAKEAEAKQEEAEATKAKEEKLCQ